MNLNAIKQTYDKDGVVRMRGLFSAGEIETVRAAIARYEKEVLPGVPDQDKVLEADGKSVRNMWRMQQHDSFFADLAARSDLTTLAETLVGSRPICMAVETFLKPARTGSAVPNHQDNAYFCLSPPDVFTLWVAIDPATPENGAVCYDKGSHHKMLPTRPSNVQGNSIGLAEPPPDNYEEFCGTLEPGDALAHHGQVIHRSEPNRTDQPRRGLLIVYRGEHAQIDPLLQTAYQQALVS